MKKNKVLIIVNNIDPYNLEIVNLLALPNEFESRFRFQKRYAPTILNNISVLGNKEGTVIVRNRDSAMFLPVRNIFVKEVKTYGDVIYITVKLEELVSIPDDELPNNEYMHKLNEFINETIKPFKNEPNDDLLNLLLLEDGKIYDQLTLLNESSGMSDLERWGNIIKLLSTNYELFNIDFYKIISVKQGTDSINITSSSKSKDYYYSLQSGNNYSIEIIQRTYTNVKGNSALAESRYINLKPSNDGVVIHNEKIKLLGKYDIVQFEMLVDKQPKVKRLNAFLEITNENSTYRTPFIKLPFRIKLAKKIFLLNILSFVLFIVFLFIYLFSDSIHSYFALDSYISISKLEKGSIVGMIIFANIFGSFAKEISSKLKLS